MSRRKDRERYLDRKHTNPEYDGFRGLESEPDRAGKTPLRTVTCSICGRRRNVAVGIADDGGGDLRLPQLPGSTRRNRRLRSGDELACSQTLSEVGELIVQKLIGLGQL